MKTIVLALLGAVAAVAQPVGFGVIGGMPLADAFSASNGFTFHTNSKSYILGADLELRLPLGLGLEANALYHPLSSSGTGSGNMESVSGHSFEFPIMAKYRFPSKIVKPFVEGGVSFGTLSGLTETVASGLGVTNKPATSNNPVGVVLGGGVDIHALILHIAPEIRYTRWDKALFTDPTSVMQGSQNQAEFLVDIVF
ncbi:MAG TPA: outer membrane beta-barrel protein [Bryobacteraceae bacterium]|nr:outer membrane beta-barrel protein [Bryobacteraceae bacterium]